MSFRDTQNHRVYVILDSWRVKASMFKTDHIAWQTSNQKDAQYEVVGKIVLPPNNRCLAASCFH